MQALKAHFLGQEITLVEHNGVAYVAMREIVEGIGLDWSSQCRKLSKWKSKFKCKFLNTIGRDGKTYKMLCMPVENIYGWLLCVNPNKVNKNLKDWLEDYQEESFSALENIFLKKAFKK
ncbi:hypothetical protein X808_9160 [Mannheimia varigena USDA-ARS-USMARC-1296]|uniref:Antirepressor protein ant N-terminal domain-containing protein n=1 Tax=Mannheimia varigena USDA-ARS-USMARC-1296 TaxID=1433287 RepID=W0Q980_9PAST|nr:phage antirepressor N-terminal domain-containing protein [Mannheimia varigena]AHG75439.1 hypothetical protein X808_9160 [Mannheimia varigena USDA-ARS-USMARC-1296]